MKKIKHFRNEKIFRLIISFVLLGLVQTLPCYSHFMVKNQEVSLDIQSTTKKQTNQNSAAKSIELKSPDGQIVFTFGIHSALPSYSIIYKGKKLIEESKLSFDFQETGEFGKNLTLTNPEFRDIDKFGPRLVTIFGGFMLGGGLIASGFATSLTTMVFTFGVIGSIGIGLGYSAATPCAMKWFDSSQKGLIAGIVVSGVGLSPVYITPITAFLLKANGISNTFIILGVFAIAAVLLFSNNN